MEENIKYVIPSEAIDLDTCIPYCLEKICTMREPGMKDLVKFRLYGKKAKSEDHQNPESICDKVPDKCPTTSTVVAQPLHTCQICKINIPVIYRNEHLNSSIHKTCLNIANEALERVKKQVNLEIVEYTQEYELDKKFCDVCSKIVKVDDDDHNNTDEHVRSSQNDKLMKTIEYFYVNNGFDDFDDVKEQTVTIKKGNVAAINNEEYIKMITALYKTTELNAVNDSVEMIELKLTVNIENFHGFSYKDDKIECQVCSEDIEGFETVHNFNSEHLQRIMVPADKQCLRKVDDTWCHCILCNELVDNRNDHISFKQHTGNLRNARRKFKNAKRSNDEEMYPLAYCGVCEKYIPMRCFETHAQECKNRKVAGNTNKQMATDTVSVDRVPCLSNVYPNKVFCDICHTNIEKDLIAHIRDDHNFNYDDVLATSFEKSFVDLCEPYKTNADLHKNNNDDTFSNKNHVYVINDSKIDNGSNFGNCLKTIEETCDDSNMKINENEPIEPDKAKAVQDTHINNDNTEVQNTNKGAKSKKKKQKKKKKLDQTVNKDVSKNQGCEADTDKKAAYLRGWRYILQKADHSDHAGETATDKVEIQKPDDTEPTPNSDNHPRSDNNPSDHPLNLNNVSISNNPDDSPDPSTKIRSKTKAKTKTRKEHLPVNKKYYCEFCEIYVSDLNHIFGKKHYKRLKVFKTSINKDFGVCKICKFYFKNDEKVKAPVNDDSTNNKLATVLTENELGSLDNGYVCDVCYEYLLKLNETDHATEETHDGKTLAIGPNHYLIEAIDSDEGVCKICETKLKMNTINDHVQQNEHKQNHVKMLASNAMKQTGEKYLCYVCSIYIPLYKELDHISSEEHKNALPVKYNDNTDEPEEDYMMETLTEIHCRCSVCSVIVHKEFISVHLKMSMHTKKYEKMLSDNVITKCGKMFFCHTCKVNITSLNEIRHINGKMHRKNRAFIAINRNKEDAINLFMQETEKPDEFRCSVCDVLVSSKADSAVTHISSYKHMRIYEAMLESNYIDKVDDQFSCSVCSIKFEQKALFFHINSLNHSKKLEVFRMLIW